MGETNLFSVLGLPPTLALDSADLERRYHAASRAVHPDRHATEGQQARELAVAAAAAVNRAYRTLRDPVALGRYWLELHGERLGERNNLVPPTLAALVFETQERLEALRTGGPTAAALRHDLESTRAALGEQLAGLMEGLTRRYATWSTNGAASPAVLAELKARLSEIAYLRTLAGDVDEVMGR